MRTARPRFISTPFVPPPPAAARALVAAAELADLPPVVQRYLAFMGVVGRPRDGSFRVGTSGRFRRGPDEPWSPCKSWQCNGRAHATRRFRMRIRCGEGLPLADSETFSDGEGKLSIMGLDIIPVAGELVTWLDDAILFSPSMLLDAATRWCGVDVDTFDVSFTEQERTVTARVSLNAAGAPMNVSTTDRFLEDPTPQKRGMMRAGWSTSIDGWTRLGGRPAPTGGRATWDLDGYPFTYVELSFVPETLRFGVLPEA